MGENHIETRDYLSSAIEQRSTPVTFTDDIFHSLQNVELVSRTQSANEMYQQKQTSGITDYSMIDWQDAYRRSLSSSSALENGIDQLVNHTITTTTAAAAATTNPNGYPINQDPNPERIRRPNNERITYRQEVSVRYLQPPTPPPPAPVIVREIRAPQPPEAPPLIIRQHPPAPVTPPPIIIREQPPVPPPIEPPRIVNKYLPAPPPPPRKVIVEQQEPLPQKPPPIIIEKWLPYKPQVERRVVVEHAPPIVHNPILKNTVIVYDAPHVDLVKNVRELGTVRIDPQTYVTQYGSHLASSEYVLNTMAKFGLGNNYVQMVQMQTSPRSSFVGQNLYNQQQTISYGEQYPYGDHREYLEKHVEEIVLPDGHRKRHSSVSSTNG